MVGLLKNNEKGFLLQDALVCVFIVSLISAIVFITIDTQQKINEGITNQCQIQEDDFIDHYANIEVCIECQQEVKEEAY